MTGDIQRTLQDVWNWLPAFRVLAETEHLPTAAERLHISASAISRTVGLLEDHLGVELFTRSGRSLVLNSEGHRLLEAVQSAMAGVEASLGDVLTEPLSGPLRVSSIGVLTNHFVTPVLLDLVAAHPGLVPRLDNLHTDAANRALVGGYLDLAFYYEALTVGGLSIEKIGESTASIYCGRGHPLYDAEVGALEDILDHPFSVPARGDTGQSLDGWPVDVPRKIGMRITLLTTNLLINLSGQFVTVLPDVTALPHLRAGELRRFDFDIFEPIGIYAAHRAGAGATVAAVVEAVADRVDAVAAEVEAVR